ncbi:MAG: YlbF family regulator [Eubacteriales bacterium]|nr:YlbF family regulator [Eubacteriales bacterium]
MKDNVEIYTTSLVHVIQDSREYREYEAAKAKLAEFPELKKQINIYRRDMFRLQNFTDPESIYDRLEEFERETLEFRRNPLVEEYLRTELAICRVLQKTARTVMEAVDLELDDVIWELRD